MDLNATTIRQITFGESRRGYDPQEVDDFISAIADGFDEMQERFRRAVERATRAEQQLANTPPPAAQPAPVSAAPTAEMSKVWERAALAAEQAVEEAKQTAHEIIEQANSEAEANISSAKAEAARLATEAEAQLRADVSQLESVRGQLKEDVDRFSNYLETEREKVRASLHKALSALDETATSTSLPPAVASVVTPPPIDVNHSEFNNSDDNNSKDNDSDDSSLEDGNVNASDDVWSPAAAGDDPFAPKSEDHVEVNQAANQQRSAVGSDSNKSHGDGQSNERRDYEDEQDPFLAELRRAVQDDGPLGPRDDDANHSIDHLYGDDEEDGDRSGFFRRKK